MKPGDLVKLKGGGPVMTVEAIRGNGLGEGVYCQWFVKGELHCAAFNHQSLIKAKAGRK